MGRPLKIAKAQAVLTLTATVASTKAVTVSTSLTTAGVIAGMPFVVATSTGNLVAGTTYWVLSVIDSTHFTVSATDLSTNRSSTPVTLADAGPVTVALTVGFVDAYFNNPVSGNGFPATNTATYSVVGGNTGIYGSQVLPAVAIGITGTGTITSATGNAVIYGGGTNFTAQLSAGSAIQTADGTTLGFVTSIGGYTVVNVTDTTVTTNLITIGTGEGASLAIGKPIVFSANIGGLVAGTVYYVTSVVVDDFTVGSQPGGSNIQLTTATGTLTGTQDAVTLVANATASGYNTSWVYANDEAGYIVRQKGRSKFLVTGTTTGLTGICYTSNVANTALTPNTMSIIATDAASATVYINRLSDHNADGFGNVTTALPYVVTFNTAQVANANPGQPYPIISVNKA